MPDEEDIDPLFEKLAETDGLDVLFGEYYGRLEDDLEDVLRTIEDRDTLDEMLSDMDGKDVYQMYEYLK